MNLNLNDLVTLTYLNLLLKIINSAILIHLKILISNYYQNHQHFFKELTSNNYSKNYLNNLNSSKNMTLLNSLLFLSYYSL